MRDLDLTTLRLFVSVCETRSIARAGAQASIVGSAISKRLAQLEDTLGTPLFVRRRRGVVPTAAGETLLEHARAMLGSVNRIERDMAAYAGGMRGHVRMLASATAKAKHPIKPSTAGRIVLTEARVKKQGSQPQLCSG